MSLAAVADLGRTLVLAPHPDDETIGCGGLLAVLGDAKAAVRVVLLSDGAGSHRHSVAYPAARLSALRRREMAAALGELGLAADCLCELALPDGALPHPGEPGFVAALQRLTRVATDFAPDTLVMPSQHDEHPDHRATHALGSALLEQVAPTARRLEYLVWGRAAEEGSAWTLDVSEVLARKRRAIACHRSQLGAVVTDDPHGFTLPGELIDRCSERVESYVDTTACRCHERPGHDAA